MSEPCQHIPIDIEVETQNDCGTYLTAECELCGATLSAVVRMDQWTTDANDWN